MSRRYKLIFIAIITLFLVTRLLGIDFIYHQDEHRWLLLADGTELASATPHPPMTLILLKFTAAIFGFFNLRILPIFFSLINLGLIWIIVRKFSNDIKLAMVAAALFTLNMYSLVAGLQVDMDGTILPFFVLLGYYGYSSLLKGEKGKRILFLFGAAIVGGLLTKESFVLFLGALVIDYLIILYGKNKGNLWSVVKRILRIGAPVLGLATLAYYLYATFYTTNLGTIIDYGSNFKVLNLGSRAYLELAFKVAKSFVWLSPLLTLPVVLGLFFKEIRRRQRLWYIYILINLVFYLVIFDFAKLTIERYFMFLLAPTVIIASDVIFHLYRKNVYRGLYKKVIAGAGLFSAFSFLILSRVYVILPLNPKGAYVDYVKKLDFDFLIPFSSGSGPIGFYFSAQFILWAWVISVLLLGSYMLAKRRGYKVILFMVFLVFGFGYNILFMNELLQGSLYGSPDKITHQTLDYVLNEPSITRVITYNDIAPYDLKKSGKYEARFYTAPERNYEKRMKVFDGYYMIVDFPEIGKPGRYWDLVQRCEETKRFTDKKINSYIFDCRSL